MKSNNKQTISFSLSQELIDKLRDVAGKNRRPTSTQLTIYLEEALEKENARTHSE